MLDVEHRVNSLLAEDLEVHADVMSQREAIDMGAMALFGEKYGDEVRVISIGEWARELCGGTHAQRSGQLGVVKLLGEASIGSGVRRIEALVGTDAYDFMAREHALVGQLTTMLKVRPEELTDRVAGLLAQLKDADKELAKIRAQQVLEAAGSLASNPTEVFGVAYVGYDAGEVAMADDLRKLALDVRGRMGGERPVVVVVAGIAKERPMVVVATNEEARRWGVKAGELVKLAAGVLGGGGGGKDDVAQGGGTNPAQIGEALRRVEYAVGQRVTGAG
jgi:alanyl-tRNA synthetase